jgi:hypothetical protein
VPDGEEELMRARDGALAGLVCLALASGCGVMVNGQTTKVTLARPSPDVVYVVDGGKVPQEQTELVLWNNDTHEVVAIAPDGKTAEMVIEQKVGAGGILLDLLCSLTLVGLAAPASDWVLDTWYYLAPDKIALVPTQAPEPWEDLTFAASPDVTRARER